jgi:hypothetical protein
MGAAAVVEAHGLGDGLGSALRDAGRGEGVRDYVAEPFRIFHL